MHGKTVLITGANAGMGLASTIKLAAEGAKVIMLCRNLERGNEARKEAQQQSGSTAIELMQCDLGDIASIKNFAQEFLKKYDTLDILLNNAGVVTIRRQETKDGFERVLGVNHLGHFLLTNLLLPSLQAAEQGRIVTVASGAYKAGRIHFDDLFLKQSFNPAKAYAQSKLANILFTKELARQLSNTKVTANCVHPGAVATQIGVNRDTGFGKRIVALLKPFFLTPEKGAETALYVATEPSLHNVSGQYFYKKQQQLLPAKATNDYDALRLWGWSSELTGLET
ncbi:short-chain dehydrogenase/reductase SDR [Fictibacillus macauensis ZFHKF-1]|uniref:Short-chain dehydrogenase/reductase SDR n=1 Tax=Fictibacillus macauensis ZFHKF-1 TaxID=1196324 RepID=I8UGB1_9BACL|nr:SDR family oxidoreductase [Fictibacillus macauensis]EIT85868.1 short-chain dehydrogenase/reductase SDR [Fictibacillus macauensis ZFHKF-1]